VSKLLWFSKKVVIVSNGRNIEKDHFMVPECIVLKNKKKVSNSNKQTQPPLSPAGGGDGHP
jgi:hypothetical protein